MESMCGAKISHLIEWSMVIAKMGMLTLYWNLLSKNLRQQELTWYLTILRIIMVNLKVELQYFIAGYEGRADPCDQKDFRLNYKAKFVNKLKLMSDFL